MHIFPEIHHNFLYRNALRKFFQIFRKIPLLKNNGTVHESNSKKTKTNINEILCLIFAQKYVKKHFILNILFKIRKVRKC